MKKTVLAITFMLILFIFCGCAKTEDNVILYNQRLDEFIEEYQEKNDVETICGAISENEEVIAFENWEEFGIASFYIGGDTDDIKYDISILPRNTESDKLMYTQIKGKNEYFIGIFLDDDVMVSKTESIKVIFEDQLKDKPYSIQQTLDGSNAQIISYDAEDMRSIKSIQLLNGDTEELYKID